MSVDRAAAQEMISRSGQMGVPVIATDDEVIVGFDRARLERLITRLATAAAPRPRLGLIARDRPGGGVVVGSTRPGSPAAAADLQPGDIIATWQGQPVRSLADLEALIGTLRGGQVIDLQIERQGQPVIARIAWEPPD